MKLYPFKRQSRKMVKHIQTIRRQIADELFECVWYLNVIFGCIAKI